MLPQALSHWQTEHVAILLARWTHAAATTSCHVCIAGPDILGAIWVDKEIILIDRSLDPKDNPSMQGRYRFSVAHEIGHWRLHRPYVAKDPSAEMLLRMRAHAEKHGDAGPLVDQARCSSAT